MVDHLHPVLPEKGKRLALVVGVNAAPDAQVQSLSIKVKATSDAQQMADVLKERCGFELVRQQPLLGEKATSENVKSALLTLARNRTDDDFLLFYFSGHGYPMTVSHDQTDVYLVTHNFNPVEVEEAEEMHLSMSWLRDKLYIPTEAGKVLLILDCCYAGYIGLSAPDPYLASLKGRIQHYFGFLSAQGGSHTGGLRQVLASTGHVQTATDKGNHGLMTGELLKALRGHVDDVIDQSDGFVNLESVYQYLFKTLSPTQAPSLAGDSAGKMCAFTQYKERAEELRRRRGSATLAHPKSYIPRARSAFFQPRPHELDGSARLLRVLLPEASERSVPVSRIIGLFGPHGVGKTCLAVELAYRCLEQNVFPGGVFWLSASEQTFDCWCERFAELAWKTGLLPPNEGETPNEKRRAHYFCQHLAHSKDALLILDDVSEPEQVRALLHEIAGIELACTLLYTSTSKNVPPEVIPYEVVSFSAAEESAYRLLLKDIRPRVFDDITEHVASSEARAARLLCQRVGYVPLALVQLRCVLAASPMTSLVQVLEKWSPYEVLNVADMPTTNLLWELVEEEDEQHLFLLACYFPQSHPIPLWLLGCVTGLGEERNASDQLGKACSHLAQLSLLELSPDKQHVWLHPSLREFGQRLMAMNDEESTVIVTEVERRLLTEFTALSRLEERVRRIGYWHCWQQLRVVRSYAQAVGVGERQRLAQVETWFERECRHLAANRWWPTLLPDLFYQQLYNQAVEAGCVDETLVEEATPVRWLRMERPAGVWTQPLLHVLKGHTDGVKCVAFSQDGCQIATGSYDMTVRLWDKSGRYVQTLQGHTGSINSVAFSPDGCYVLTGSDDETARLWESKSGQLLNILDKHHDRVNIVRFSADGERLLTGSGDKTIRIWRRENGVLLETFRCDALAVNQQWIVAGGGGLVGIWDGNDATMLARLDCDGTNVTSMALAGNRSLVGLGTLERMTQIWDYDKEELLTTLPGHIRWISCVAFSPDGELVATGSDDTTTRVWHWETGNVIELLAGHEGRINAVAFSPDGQHLLTGSDDGTVGVWTYTKRMLSAEDRNEFTEHVLFANAETASSLYQRRDATAPYDCALFSPDGQQVLVSNAHDRKVRIWDGEGRHLRTLLEGNSDIIIGAAFTPDGERVFTSSRDGTARIWSCASGKALVTWTVGDNVISAAFAPDGQHLLTNYGAQGMLWECASGKRVGAFEGHEDQVLSVAFSSSGKWVLTRSENKTVRVWNAKTCAQLNMLEHTLPVTCASFSPDEQQVLTYCVADQSLRIWDRAEGHLLHTYLALPIGYVFAITFSPDGQLIALCDESNHMLLLKGVGPDRGQVLGACATPSPVRAIHWADRRHLILVDTGGPYNFPHFYRYQLEGMW